MAAKRVDPLKAKAAKQKKMAIGLCVVFVAVLAFQGPKTLKMLKGPQPEATAVAAPATTTPVDPNAAPAPASATGAPVSAGSVPLPASGALPAGEAQPAVLVDSDLPAEAGDGQLRSFERFQTRDPFAQQNDVTTLPRTSPAPATNPEVVISLPPTPSGGAVVAPPGAGVTGTPGTTGTSGTPGSTPPASTPPASTTPAEPAPLPAAATTISVNGVEYNVPVAASFPDAAQAVDLAAGLPAPDPVFVLVSLAADGKSVELGIAGGAYADGAETIKLRLGKPLTLRNTADGSQFVLLLKTVAGFAPAQAPKQK